MNRIGWLDTLRVLASFLVIISHYSYAVADVPSVEDFLHTYVLRIGQIGNMLFFAVSGYLASNSLEHSKSIWEFYRRKIIRIAVPFAVAYLVLATLLILFGMFEPSLADQSPLKKVINTGGSYTAFLIGMTPLSMDRNFLFIFDLPVYKFIGEWFIGIIIWLYLISPLLDKCLRRNFFLTVFAAILISFGTFELTKFLHAQGLITKAQVGVVFPVRIPEFLFGMILYVKKDFIAAHFQKLIYIFAGLLAVLTCYELNFYPYKGSFFEKLIMDHPPNIWKYLFAASIFTFLIYSASIYLNKRFENLMAWFNNFSKISYVAMLIQHVIIYRFTASYDFSTMSKFGILFFLAVIILTTIFLSEQIHKVYKPLEERLIKRRLLLE